MNWIAPHRSVRGNEASLYDDLLASLFKKERKKKKKEETKADRKRMSSAQLSSAQLHVCVPGMFPLFCWHRCPRPFKRQSEISIAFIIIFPLLARPHVRGFVCGVKREKGQTDSDNNGDDDDDDDVGDDGGGGRAKYIYRHMRLKSETKNHEMLLFFKKKNYVALLIDEAFWSGVIAAPDAKIALVSTIVGKALVLLERRNQAHCVLTRVPSSHR